MTLKEIWYRVKQIPLIGIPYEKMIGNKKGKKLIEKQYETIQKEGVMNIKKIEEVLSSFSMIFFADWGTLLGIVRNHKLITWDTDIDYGIIVNEDFNWKELERKMKEKGYKKKKEWRLDGLITEQTYGSNRITFDIFAHYETQNSLISFAYSKLENVQYRFNEYSVYRFDTCFIKDTRLEILDDIKVHVPKNAEEYLAFLYNDSWREPDPNWIAFSGKGCTYVENKLVKLTIY